MMPSKSISELEQAVADARLAVQVRQVEGELHPFFNEVALEEAEEAVKAAKEEIERFPARHGRDLLAAMENVAVCEEELFAAQQLLASMGEGVVLSGEQLLSHLTEVRAEVVRGEQILADRAGSDERVFACRRVERAKCDLRAAIAKSRPASDEKERLQHSLAALDEDYAVLTSHDPNPADLAVALARISEANCVDREWLRAQKDELSRVPTEAKSALDHQPAHALAR